jgi:uncharacterized protein (UPF0332 family)
MARADEAFKDAVALIDQLRWNGAVNRLYYAAFHASQALLATRGLISKSHSGAIKLFQEHFVKAGHVSPAVARFLPRAFEMRQDADYGDYEEATRDDVEQLRASIATFLAACRETLTSLTSEDDA